VKRKTIGRLIAVLLVGYGFAFLIMSADATNMARYRTLSREALIKTLTEKNTDSFDGAFFISVMLVGFITASVEALAAIAVLAIDRISPPPRPVAPEADPDG
jgi:hypothetical protein